jgi:FMN phosphatase YigB (HAD superfamily)
VTTSPLVIFDIGNTLVHGPDVGPAARLTGGLGLAADPGLSELLMTTDFADAAALAAALESRYSLPRGSAHDVAREVWDGQLQDASPIDGALDALRSLSAAGLRLALLSNIWRPYALSVHRWFGPVFDAAIPAELQCLSYQAGLAKPAPELFTRLLSQAATPANRAVMVGDSMSRDIVPAARLGLRTVLVGEARPADVLADRVLSSVAWLTVELVADLCAGDPAPGPAANRGTHVLR